MNAEATTVGPTPLPADQFERVLVIRTGHLGDTLCAIPAFRLLRKYFPHARLSLLCDRPDAGKVAAREVVERLGLFDEIVTYRAPRSLGELWELYRIVRQQRPQLVVQLPQQDRTAQGFARQRYFFRAAGIHHLIGFVPTGHHRDWNPTEADRQINLLNAAGIVGPKPEYDLPVDSAARQTLREKLLHMGLAADEPYLVFCGGGKTTSQHWPLAWYSEVLSRLHLALGMPIVGVGTPVEMAAYRHQVSPDFPHLLLPEKRWTLFELFELLRGATAYLGNDTGPMHVAAAVRCPTVAIISARNWPGQFDPDVEPRLLLRHRTPCEGCHLDDCTVPGHPCLRTITPDIVVDKAQAFLARLLERSPHRAAT